MLLDDSRIMFKEIFFAYYGFSVDGSFVARCFLEIVILEHSSFILSTLISTELYSLLLFLGFDILIINKANILANRLIGEQEQK